MSPARHEVLAGLALGALVSNFAPSPAFAAGWADANCNFSQAAPTPSGPYTRQQAYNVYSTAIAEGYHWGGGCFNDNNIDDSPGEPVQTESTHGEGPDCSGLVFKTWMLGNSSGTTAFYKRAKLNYYHGPFASGSFQSSTVAWSVIPKANAAYLDAFASSYHIGMVQYKVSSGVDWIFEAKSEGSGTNVWQRSYRDPASTDYTNAAQRNGWA